MSIAQDFKKFVMRGNVVDLAVGVIIGSAFGKIVSSLVADVIMPPIGVLLGNIDFKDIKITLKEASEAIGAEAASPAVTLNIGNFLQTVVDFTIIAAAVFGIVQLMTKLQRKQDAAAPSAPVLVPPTPSETLLTEIRDLLKK